MPADLTESRPATVALLPLTAGRNVVVFHTGEARFAFCAHLKPGSVRVGVGTSSDRESR
jgi:hypothetical protein